MQEQPPRQGPLTGIRVLEFIGLGPAPHCAMLLADLGADVVRIERSGGNGWPNPVQDRGRRILELDIRSDEGRKRCLELAAKADVLIEGYRPGTMERLGLGPDALQSLNPGLIYGRITGWGQTGPLAQSAGHDINYIALAGALASMGTSGAPPPPLNLVGDYGGGSMLLAFGVLAALIERQNSGKGQIIDAAIVDGVSSLMSLFTGLAASGSVSMDRDRNLIGGAAPYYRSYACSDGRYIAIGALEPKFFAELLDKLNMDSGWMALQNIPAKWPELEAEFTRVFAARTQPEWCNILEGTDACFAPVLALSDVSQHPHIRARETYVQMDGQAQSAPVPKFSRTPGAARPSVTLKSDDEIW
ncbi:CaiB/BaiF CoA-transferase family protein [Phyllobacterium sp. YR531]|uniref:CaiB/BaiF CoA transferase family protein n=1 Tax=Phyllobacterium sp. YR531 TaxID=1144343 RepID=UPI00026FB2B9|nr:CaiB/BaiF CoA-transferase family protein [Phyllobacterium sp. YR531]EJN00351.1 putative acyl-CoA transferase/carnitine dehydratase [Phyllobacterium sp. YR531]